MLRVLFVIGVVTGLFSSSSAHIQTRTDQYLAKNLSNEECVQRIYRDCNFPTTFTYEELENVRQFLNHSFSVLADIKPDKPLCPKLHVRHDWKCLSQQQKRRVVNVWRKMYERRDVQRLTDIHVKTWPAWHKSVEFLPSHRWFSNQFEKIMRYIDPGVSLPYWDPFTYGVQPHRSSVWETLGHAGHYSNGYSVPDGIYSKWGLIPTIKRHWQDNGTILPWFTQEIYTSIIQTSNSYQEVMSMSNGVHFPPHLNIGGYEGQYSYRNAPYDCLFYMHHTSNIDVTLTRWQFKNSKFLTPLSYNIPNGRFDYSSGIPLESNIEADVLTGVPSVTIRELFWLGFGDLCFIPDQLVRPINNIMKGIRDPIPTAAERLPKKILEKYFPVFNSGNFSGISHTLEEVGDCNTVCHPIPRPTFMRETKAGKRQFEAYRYDNGLDLTPQIEQIEKLLEQMWSDLNQSGYCSPYVTTY